MPTWRQRQDLGPSSTVLFVVGKISRLSQTSGVQAVPIETHWRILHALYWSDTRVPKELISRFVKICPTCQVRRGGSRLTPPNSRRSSPRLEIAPRSPKLPSPPISRRESAISHHIQPDRTQADYFNQFSGHTSWVDSQRQLQGRQNMGSIRPFVSGAVNHLPEPLTGAVESFHGDISTASAQVDYNSGYASTQGAPSQRDFWPSLSRSLPVMCCS